MLILLSATRLVACGSAQLSLFCGGSGGNEENVRSLGSASDELPEEIAAARNSLMSKMAS